MDASLAVSMGRLIKNRDFMLLREKFREEEAKLLRLIRHAKEDRDLRLIQGSAIMFERLVNMPENIIQEQESRQVEP